MAVNYSNRIHSTFLFSLETEYRQRKGLENNLEQGIFKNNIQFEPNYAENLENGNTLFKNDQQLFFKGTIQWQPFTEFRRFNKYVYLSNTKGVTFRLAYSQAMLDNPFSALEFSVNNRLNLNRFGMLRYQVSYQKFLNKPISVLDFAHFKGNEIIFTTRFNEGFKALPYYLFSTSENNIKGNFTWEPRKFLITQINLLYAYGLKESLQYNGLYVNKTGKKDYYHEMVYSLDGIGGIFGVDLAIPLGNLVSDKFKVLIRVPF